MALSPKEMSAAIIRNMKEKTGKSTEEWIKLLRKNKLQDKKEVIEFLKTENGLGHFQARTVYEEYIK